MEMREEVLSSLGTQDKDTGGYQVSDLDDNEFSWKRDQLDADAVFTLSIDTPFSPSTFKDFEMGSKAENPLLIDEEQDKDNSSPRHPTTPFSERTTHSLLLRRRPFETKNEIVSEYVYRNMFE